MRILLPIALLVGLMALCSSAEGAEWGPGFGLRSAPYGVTIGDWNAFAPAKPQMGFERYGQSSAHLYVGQGVGVSAVTFGGQVLGRLGPGILSLDGAQMGAFLGTKQFERNRYFWAPMMAVGIDTSWLTLVAKGGWSVRSVKGHGLKPKGDLSYGAGLQIRVSTVTLSGDVVRMGESTEFMAGVAHGNFHVAGSPSGVVLMMKW